MKQNERIKLHPQKERNYVLYSQLCPTKKRVRHVVYLYCYLLCLWFFKKCLYFLHILMGCLSFIVELQVLFIYSEYKSFDRYIQCKYVLSLFLSFFFMFLLIGRSLNILMNSSFRRQAYFMLELFVSFLNHCLLQERLGRYSPLSS